MTGYFPSGGWGWRWVGDPDRGYGRAQPGGWVFTVLPFVEQDNLFKRGAGAAAAVKRTEGRAVSETPLKVFNCPTRRGVTPFVHGAPPRPYFNIDQPAQAGRSDYAANAGNGPISTTLANSNRYWDDGPADFASEPTYQWWGLNHNGVIAGAELDQCPGLKAGLAVIDKDRDRRLTAEEIAARVAQYQEDKGALFGITGYLTLDGRPLEGATVKLAPERFMGPAVKPAKGITDAGGYCSFQIEGETLRGVHPGVYRIEVSKKDAGGQETLPARYNTTTTHGTEVGVGGIASSQGIELALTSR